MRQRWHPWRRRYDLFMGKRQFAAIDGPFLAWEFELKDGGGNTLALIDRCVCVYVCQQRMQSVCRSKITMISIWCF